LLRFGLYGGLLKGISTSCQVSTQAVVLKGEEQVKTERQYLALQEMENSYFATAKVYRIKEFQR
jgi:hypothetical protein